MKRQIGWSLTFILGVLVVALTVGAFMQAAPGLLPLFPIAALCYFARPMTWESEFELAMRTLSQGAA